MSCQERRLLVKRLLCVGLVVLSAFAFAAETNTAEKTVKATGWAAKMEQLAMAMLPQERVDQMMGFFGPVVKKYMPVFNQFQQEYQTAQQKLPVVLKYLPKADEAVAEAKAMKVPAKYEAQKAEYVGEVESFLSMAKMSANLANRLKAKPAGSK